MKKLLVILGMIFLSSHALFCQSLDYRQVIFGNNYEQIQEINADEFFAQYPQVKDKYSYSKQRYPVGLQPVLKWENYSKITIAEEKNYARVYEQKIGENIFYRILFSNEELSDERIKEWEMIYVEQYVFYKKSDSSLFFIDIRVLGADAHYQSLVRMYEGLEVIARNGKIFGIFCYGVNFSYNEKPYTGGSYGNYYLWKEITNAETKKHGTIKYINSLENDVPNIKVQASKPLIDARRPFMYTIQNAFDGNPATSYVEDTEDDLMNISVGMYVYGKADKFFVINGYAQNETTYKNNNRVKAISDQSTSAFGTVTVYSDKKILFKDNELGKQIFEWWGGSFFSVTDIYEGEKYTDTCLAELDFYINEYGWLFGGIDE